MKLLFKHTEGNNVTDKSIVGNSNFKEHLPSVHKNMAWLTLQPFIRQATRDLVRSIIGMEYYDELATKYQAGDNLDAYEAEVLELLQDASAYYTNYYASRSLNVSIADMGVQQQQGREGSSTPVNQWSFKDQLWASIERGDKALDQALELMEKRVIAGDTNFNTWKSSTAYTSNFSDFFRMTSDLSDLTNIQGSRRSFVAILPYLREVEETHVKPILCDDFYNEIIAKVKDGTGTAKEKQVIKYCRKIAAHIGLFEAVPQIAMSIKSTGFVVVSRTDGFEDHRAFTNSEHGKLKEALRFSSENLGRQATADLVTYLYTNKDDFATWTASDCYKESSYDTHRPVIASRDRRGGVMF